MHFSVMNFRLAPLLFGLSLIVTVSQGAWAQPDDVRNTEDHPLLSRFPDTFIRSQKRTDYGRVYIATGVLTPELRSAGGRTVLPPVRQVEGEVTSTYYRANSNETSPLRIFRSYEKALSDAGFREIFSCESDAGCGARFVSQLYWYGDASRRGQHDGLDTVNIGKNHQYFYWAGEAQIDGRTYVVALMAAQRVSGGFPTDVVLDVVEITDVQLANVTVNLTVEDLSRSITQTGRAVLDGIYFAVDDATLTPASAASIKTIAEFLKANASQGYYVVGHTDNSGDFAANRALSERRAQSVIEQLVAVEGVEQELLRPIGVGPVSPVATNKTQQGRSLNRRVELVPVAKQK